MDDQAALSSRMSPSRKPTEPPQRTTRPSAMTTPGPAASKKLILSSSVGTALAKLPLAIAAWAIAVSTMPVRKPPWQMRPCEWQKAGTISKRKRQKPRFESSSMTSPFRILTGSVVRALRTFSASESLSAPMSTPAKSGWVEFMGRGLYRTRAGAHLFEKVDQRPDFGGRKLRADALLMRANQPGKARQRLFPVGRQRKGMGAA